MLALLQNLLRSFAYRIIKHPQLDAIRERLPFIAAAIFCFGFLSLPGQAHLTGESSLSSFAFDLLIPLPGFFIAALAAIATFNRPEMDLQMPSPTPTVSMTTRGKSEDVPLTFRMFIGYIFSYLSIASLIGAAAIGLCDISNNGFSALLVDLTGDQAANSVLVGTRMLYTFLVFWLLFDILLATLLGLYFLVERIHRPHA